MKRERIIPITPIWLRYQQLRREPQKRRLEEARRLAENPSELISELRESVARFSTYENVDDHFYPETRPKHAYAASIGRTIDLVLRLEEQRQLHLEDSASRMFQHDGLRGVMPVPAERLACTYVDRELLVQRTTSPARWEDGSRNLGGLRLDVLLSDAADHTPIVGELKLPGDMDPFFALIQGLACAAHLATPSQFARMRRHLEHCHVPASAAPVLDVWILAVRGADHQPGQRPRGRYMAALEEAAERLAPQLIGDDPGPVRRIASVELTLTGAGKVSGKVDWAWERSAI